MKKMKDKMKNILTYGNAIRVIIVLLLCYQLYDYTSQYLEYKTVVRMELKPFIGGQMPSITLCSRSHSWMFVQKKKINVTKEGIIIPLLRYEFVHLNNDSKSKYRYNESSWSLDVSYSTIYRKIYLPVFEDNDYFNTMTDLILSNISSYKCLTLFNKIQLKNRTKFDKHIEKKRINLEMRIELPILFLHFKRIRNLRFYLKIHSSDSIISLIPWENYLLNNRGYKYSMRSTSRHLLPPPYHTNCYDYDKDLMNGNIDESNITRQSCKIEKFELKLFNSIIRKEDADIYIIRRYNDEHFYHLPALYLIDCSSSIGGAFTFWIGISVWSFSVGIEKKLESLINNSVFLKYITQTKVIIYSICLIFLSIQIYLSSVEYLSYDYVVRIRPDVRLIFPRIKEIHETAIDINKLFSTSCSEQKKSREEFIKNSFNSFEMNCKIIVNSDIRNSRDCGNHEESEIYYYRKVEDHIHYIRKLLILRKRQQLENSSYFIDYNSNPIMIIKCSFNSNFISELKLYLDQQFMFGHQVLAKFSQTFSFTQRSVHLLPPPFTTKCVKYQYRSSIACYMDCLDQNSLALFHCNLYEKVEISLFKNNMEWCQDKFRFNSSIYVRMSNTFGKNCTQVCSNECESNMYEYKLTSKSFIESNESIIKIFPSEKPYIKYIYSAKMDFNQLIYHIGGIIGFCFGYSALSFMNSLIALWKRMISLKIIENFYRNLIRRNKLDMKEMKQSVIRQSLIESDLTKRKMRRRNSM